MTRRRVRSGAARTAATLAFVGAGLIACDAAVPSSASTTHAFGEPIEPGPAPDPVTCQRLIRGEIGAAVRIRTELMTPGVGADEASARAAAGDPRSTLALIGVPLTEPESGALKKNGVGLDPWAQLTSWVHVGAPERFGGIWVPDGLPIVAVLDNDAGALAIARCVGPAGTREVWADISYAAGEALLTRIGTDQDRWEASGVRINSMSFDETAGVVEVGVSAPTPQLEAALRDAYGPHVRVRQADQAQPL